MDCKILQQYSLIIDPSIETKKKIDFFKVLDKETPLRGSSTLAVSKNRFFFFNFNLYVSENTLQKGFRDEKGELYGPGIGD